RVTRIRTFKAAVMIQREERRLQIVQRRIHLLDIIHDVALSYEEILPAIIIKVFKPHAPTRAAGGETAQTGGQAAIAEGTVAIIVIHGVDLAGEVGYDDIGFSIVIVIAKIDTHAGVRLAIVGERDVGIQRALLEAAAAEVVK